jgi:hypothetical protein
MAGSQTKEPKPMWRHLGREWPEVVSGSQGGDTVIVNAIVAGVPYSHAVYDKLQIALIVVAVAAWLIDGVLSGEPAINAIWKPPLMDRPLEERRRILRLATSRAPIRKPDDIALVQPFAERSLEQEGSWRWRMLVGVLVAYAVQYLYPLVVNISYEQWQRVPWNISALVFFGALPFYLTRRHRRMRRTAEANGWEAAARIHTP